MTARLSESYTIERDVETVFAALSGDGWAPAKAAALSDGSRTVRRDVGADGSVELVVSRELPDGVPGFLTRFLPKDGRAEQTDSWGPAVDGTRSGTWRADIPGAPARVGGTMRLEPDGTGARYVIDGEVKVSVPLVGGKAESFLVDAVRSLTAKEAEVLRGMLAG